MGQSASRVLRLAWLAIMLWPVSTARGLESRQWLEDIDTLRHQIESTHPSPWTRISQQDWMVELEAIRGDLAHGDDSRTAVRLMQLVARLGDTHTNLLPSAAVGFDHWFPMRIYEFSDGYFVTAIDSEHADLVASKVLTVDGMDIAEAAEKARSPRSSENPFGRQEATHYLSSPAALAALGVIRSPQSINLTLVDRNGAPRTVRISAHPGDESMSWSQWGEMFGPLFGETPKLVTAFDGLSPMDYRMSDERRPLHLRHRGRYAFWHLEDQRTIYAQINFMLDSDEEPFETGFMRALFDAVDRTVVDRLIVDLRYNGGGDGSMAIPFVHELIKRDHSINRPGHLFVLVGRKTFSAAVSLLDQIDDHTAAILIGEPPRSPFNHYGDPTTTALPNSRMSLSVSNRYWQFSTSDDARKTIPVHYPAPFSSSDYFSGRDPALDAIFAGKVKPLPDLVQNEGGAAALAIVDAISADHGRPDWWIPFGRRAMRHAGRDLIAADRIADGVTAYELNTRFHGDSWRVWDSLGDGLHAAGNTEGAIEAYRKALDLKPDNWNARHQRKMIESLSSHQAAED